MRKEKIKQYDETNFTKSPMHKKYVRKRRKEKFFRFITLPTFLWTIFFVLLSSVLLVISYFTRISNPWVSGVLVSIACGVITGITLYFLSNLRTNKLHSIEAEESSIYAAYKFVCDIVLEKAGIDNSRILEPYFCTVENEAYSIMEKLGEIRIGFYEGKITYSENVEELELLEIAVYDFWEKYEFLSNNSERQDWINAVIDFMTDEKSKLEFLMKKNGDKIRCIKKYIF